ncbi:hypothetical protein N7526_011282 [Penicillium atrosanguineum]|nr:hypothetical protein N7526_011282 [Penicillium atrosanguineum]
MVAITLPSNYGGVIAVALGAIPVLGFIHGMVTGSFRKQAKCKENAKAEQFNCAQRAHANFLENAPPDYALRPGLWVVFRSLFLYGYVYSGKPQGKGRMMGGFFWLAQGALWGLSVFGVARDLISY